jgi:hypothetical protein
MRAVQIMLAAVLLGLLGGYGWSAMQRRALHVHIPKAINPRPVEIPETASDREWAARALGNGRPQLDANEPDPTAVEQSAFYANCDAVRAAGKDPLHPGDPGYRPELDANGDGSACERDRGNSRAGRL